MSAMLFELSEKERAILAVLCEQPEDFGYLGFDWLAEATGLDRKEVRQIVRGLAAKGLAQYGRGLWTDDGTPAGSGYCASDTARKMAADQKRIEWQALLERMRADAMEKEGGR